MNLPVPSVGSSDGPQYAIDINNCMNIIDSHNHTPGNGNQIPASGLNIVSDLTINNNNLTNIRTLRFRSQGSSPSNPSDIGCMYEVGNDLWYNNGVGQAIQLTVGGSIAGAAGSITNLVSPASASYNSQTFTWRSNVNTPANMDNASVILRNLSASSYGCTLNPPPAMIVDQSITLPTIPASTLPLVMDSSGVMSTQQITLAMIAQAVKDALAPPVGSVLAYSGTTAPSGYLLCDGSAVSRTTYASLYAVIGNSCGYGDNTTTFNLPDFRGQFLRGQDRGRGLDPQAAVRTAMNTGGNVGDNVGSIQSSAQLDHDHSMGSILTSVGSTTLGLANSGGLNVVRTLINNYSTVFTGPSSGATISSEVRPVNAYVNYIIKT